MAAGASRSRDCAPARHGMRQLRHRSSARRGRCTSPTGGVQDTRVGVRRIRYLAAGHVRERTRTGLLHPRRRNGLRTADPCGQHFESVLSRDVRAGRGLLQQLSGVAGVGGQSTVSRSAGSRLPGRGRHAGQRRAHRLDNAAHIAGVRRGSGSRRRRERRGCSPRSRWHPSRRTPGDDRRRGAAGGLPTGGQRTDRHRRRRAARRVRGELRQQHIVSAS